MAMLDELKALGVSVDAALAALGGNSALYERLIFKLRDKLKAADEVIGFDEAHLAETEETIHALKGASGSLSFTPLFEGYSEAMRLLREHRPQQAEKVINELEPLKNNIVSCIDKYSA